MTTSFEQLQMWETELHKSDGYVCGFEHHSLDDGPDSPLCPHATSNYRHGCAHGNYFVHRIIGEMRRGAFLTPKEADELSHRTNDREEITRLDFRVALDWLNASEHGAIKNEQETIIGRRQTVAQELLERVTNAIRVLLMIAEARSRVELLVVGPAKEPCGGEHAYRDTAQCACNVRESACTASMDTTRE